MVVATLHLDPNPEESMQRYGGDYPRGRARYRAERAPYDVPFHGGLRGARYNYGYDQGYAPLGPLHPLARRLRREGSPLAPHEGEPRGWEADRARRRYDGRFHAWSSAPIDRHQRHFGGADIAERWPWTRNGWARSGPYTG